MTDLAASHLFALENAGVNAFLHASVGTELNGSSLTILSMLARLGLDPWSEAAAWAKLPRAAATARLTQAMARMPMTPESRAGAPAVAARLTQLLPSSHPSLHAPAARSFIASLPGWAPMALVAAALVLGFAVNALIVPHLTSTHTAEPFKPSADPAPSHGEHQ
jgi:hypothetical protein